jgi:hypothetical protein
VSLWLAGAVASRAAVGCTDVAIARNLDISLCKKQKHMLKMKSFCGKISDSADRGP